MRLVSKFSCITPAACVTVVSNELNPPEIDSFQLTFQIFNSRIFKETSCTSVAGEWMGFKFKICLTVATKSTAK
jgi:hypothetical protein